jgi:hypothetical protein
MEKCVKVAMDKYQAKAEESNGKMAREVREGILDPLAILATLFRQNTAKGDYKFDISVEDTANLLNLFLLGAHATLTAYEKYGVSMAEETVLTGALENIFGIEVAGGDA